ncbi:M15 family metallopeptidase [Thermosediminibacter litoriperuensis]|uniref:D-alanyl-D-alanine carboxypeptidase n=1 Tax=Thermosediminibacter litoriperuensis TaxID=291989 RepID=A0A5S5AVQ1_9FIRM|nr:M15 family metallopeptidase [Thermosediminibacter litoriperuensis]TYP56178.1 D-alanyl-D-alanine carboxypeptidase [Thermosediminibacter litoriperuensis]
MKKIIPSFITVLFLLFIFSAEFSVSSLDMQAVGLVVEPEPVVDVAVPIQADYANGKITIGGKGGSAEALVKPHKFEFKDIGKGNLILVNQSYPVEKHFFHPAMSDLEGRVPCSKSSLILAEEAANQLAKMFEDAKSEGVNDLTVVSAYRSYSYQTALFNNKVNTYIKKGKTKSEAKKLAGKVVAAPGTSEHQTGLAVDIFSKELLQRTGGLEEVFDQSDEGKWLIKNSHKYGFILRYPQDKQDLTRIIYEPWHYRYVGKPHAEIMVEKNMCLEEYIEYLKENQRIEYTSSNGETFLIYYLDNASDLNDIEVYAYVGQAVNASSDNTGGLILTVRMDKII